MTVATHRMAQLSTALQSLIESRLDTIDRMLLARVGRGERLAIVREVESQIDELLGERETDELSREDVLAVLGQLDPPEAYLADEVEGERRVEMRTAAPQAERVERQGGRRGAARASGLLGLGALFGLVLLVLSYFVAVAFNSETPLLVGVGFSIPCTFVCSVLSIALGIYARKSGVWALVGIITGSLALLFWSLALFVLILELRG
jgi:hypothetical protein